ncbi:hypothetical protein CYY_004933 [Polysphondylium violaceum]|uniref:Trafficking protein particle complex subunit 13 C-terminal domain-containing protein n=1 Tax=Polysphondylium violaceum TaxID=133409 RepID=A0A8J4PXC4_9MYCE|nr:hypothetical protein CYY_004933 [Polysphondylium violaceum]
MSSTTLSAMIMGMADGEFSSLGSINSVLEDVSVDEDDFHSSTFDIYTPEYYDSRFMTDYEYISNNADRFIDCKSRDYIIQGELLKFFIIVRPPESSKQRQRQQEEQMKQQQQQRYNQSSILNSNRSTPPLSKLNISEVNGGSSNSNTIDAPTLIIHSVPDDNSNSNNNNSNSNNKHDENKITVLHPHPSSSNNLIFDLQLRLAADYERSTKDNSNPVNIIDYNPKHSHVPTEMKNDHISASKVTMNYLRQPSPSLSSTASPGNISPAMNSTSPLMTSPPNLYSAPPSPTTIAANINNSRFLGDLIEVSSPFTFKDPSSMNQKPNFFKLSNGDIVFPIEIPIYIREINEDKSITLVIKVNRPKITNRTTALSSESRLERLIHSGGVAKNAAGGNSSNTTTSTKLYRTFFKSFTLLQPMKMNMTHHSSYPTNNQVNNSQLANLGNKSLISVSIENIHPNMSLMIKNLDIYLFHVLNMESITLVDPNLGTTTGAPTHRQIGNLVKVNEHYVIKNLTNYKLPIVLEPHNQFSFILSVEPTTIHRMLPPTDGFHTKIKVSWEIPSSCGQILSLYDLKINPPFTAELIVSTDHPSPVALNEKFFVHFKICNLSNTTKNLSINIPSATLKQSLFDKHTPKSPTLNDNNGKKTNINSNINNSNTTVSKSVSTDSLSSNKSSNQLKNSTSISSNATTSTTSPTTATNPLSSSSNLKSSLGNSTSKYIPVESHIQFSEITSKTLMSYDTIQKSTVHLMCLEKSINIGNIEPKNSLMISVEFLPLSTGIFEIPNITLVDSVEQKTFYLKDSLQICCVKDSVLPN